jgi:hypothetical protein
VNDNHPVVPGNADRLAELVDTRVRHPERVAELAAARTAPQSLVGETGRLMVVAADHTARGALRAGADALAMASTASWELPTSSRTCCCWVRWRTRSSSVR